MGLKYQVSKADYESLGEDVKSLYSLEGENYQLAIEGLPKPEDVTGLKTKVEQLLSEKKLETDKRKAAEEAKAAEERERAKQQNDFEALFKSSEAEREKIKSEHQQLLGQVQTEKVGGEALRLASQLADGDNAELLTAFIKPRLQYTNDGLKVLDQNGQLTVSSLEDLKNEIQSSGRYNALLRGNQSGGGGAANSDSKSGGAATIQRTDFDTLEPSKQMEFVKGGGQIQD